MVQVIEHPLLPDAPLVDAVRAIEASRRRIAVVADRDGVLRGTLTDGDVRRCLLAGGNLETQVGLVMNASPIVALDGSGAAYLLDLMRRGNVLAVPLVDTDGRFVRLAHLTDLEPDAAVAGGAEGFSFAVIMAGGEGTRLRPYTEKVPKPMVEVGGTPLLERQVLALARAGVARVYVSLNYLGHVIEEHFGAGERFGLEIRYLRESEKLGTGGALSLLPEVPDRPIIVMNGDIITDLSFADLHQYHVGQRASVTVAAVDYRVSIPYGVIVAEGASVRGLAEKPSQRFLCNAGLYAVSPEALALIPRGRQFNMTDLINASLESHRHVAVFPVHEYWSDIGTPDDLARARALFTKKDDQR